MNLETTITEGESASPLLFDSIVSRIRPLADSFEIAIATGDVLRFRHVRGRDALRQIREAAHRFAEGVTTVNAPLEMKAFVSSDRQTMIWCHMLGALNLDGGTAWSFLQIQYYGPVVFDDLLEQFKTELLHVAEATEMRDIDLAKKGSGSRFFGATDSKSPATCGVAIPESSMASSGTTP